MKACRAEFLSRKSDLVFPRCALIPTSHTTHPAILQMHIRDPAAWVHDGLARPSVSRLALLIRSIHNFNITVVTIFNYHFPLSLIQTQLRAPLDCVPSQSVPKPRIGPLFGSRDLPTCKPPGTLVASLLAAAPTAPASPPTRSSKSSSPESCRCPSIPVGLVCSTIDFSPTSTSPRSRSPYPRSCPPPHSPLSLCCATLHPSPILHQYLSTTCAYRAALDDRGRGW
ncbi:hypothetical protein V8F33_003294 [Rhypophila sp. PSN 637]